MINCYCFIYINEVEVFFDELFFEYVSCLFYIFFFKFFNNVIIEEVFDFNFFDVWVLVDLVVVFGNYLLVV